MSKITTKSPRDVLNQLESQAIVINLTVPRLAGPVAQRIFEAKKLELSAWEGFEFLARAQLVIVRRGEGFMWALKGWNAWDITQDARAVDFQNQYDAFMGYK